MVARRGRLGPVCARGACPALLRGPSTSPLERMSRQCPACGRTVSIWRWSGPVVRYHRKEGASWFRYTPQHFYCRNCGVEIRSVILPLGYFAWAVMAGLFVLAAMAPFSQRLWAVVAPYSRYIPLWWVASCLVICLVGVRWGTRFTLVGDNAGQQS